MQGEVARLKASEGNRSDERNAAVFVRLAELRRAGLEVWPAVSDLGGLSGLRQTCETEVIPWLRDPQLSLRRVLCAGLPGMGKSFFARWLAGRIGAECVAHDIPFFLEFVGYDPQGDDEKSLEYAKKKPEIVTRSMQEFSKPQYFVDVLKVEVPINAEFVEGKWVGQELRIGDDVVLEITDHCPRCVMTTLPQGDLPKDSGILRTAARHNDVHVGVYAEVRQ